MTTRRKTPSSSISLRSMTECRERGVSLFSFHLPPFPLNLKKKKETDILPSSQPGQLSEKKKRGGVPPDPPAVDRWLAQRFQLRLSSHPSLAASVRGRSLLLVDLGAAQRHCRVLHNNGGFNSWLFSRSHGAPFLRLYLPLLHPLVIWESGHCGAPPFHVSVFEFCTTYLPTHRVTGLVWESGHGGAPPFHVSVFWFSTPYFPTHRVAVLDLGKRPWRCAPFSTLCPLVLHCLFPSSANPPT